MRRIILAAILGVLCPASAFATCTGQLAAYSLCGNPGSSEAIPGQIVTGAGVIIALGINVGNAGSIVVNGGALGTPSSGTLTNATGLPISTGLSGAGTGVITAMANPVNATGGLLTYGIIGTSGATLCLMNANCSPSGNWTFSGSNNYGTPSAIALTNATGLPISTGVAGLGTGVATALGVNVGTAGSFLVNGGALGTPSSGTLTNATGLPIATGLSGAGTGVITAMGNAVNATGGLLTYGIIGTSGATLCLMNATNCAPSGNWAWTGSVGIGVAAPTAGLAIGPLASGTTSLTVGANPSLPDSTLWNDALMREGSSLTSNTNAGNASNDEFAHYMASVQQLTPTYTGTTNASTSTSSAVLNFASTPAGVIAGMLAIDTTTPGALTGQYVLSTTPTTVTLSGNVTATVGSGDSITFGFGNFRGPLFLEALTYDSMPNPSVGVIVRSSNALTAYSEIATGVTNAYAETAVLAARERGTGTGTLIALEADVGVGDSDTIASCVLSAANPCHMNMYVGALNSNMINYEFYSAFGTHWYNGFLINGVATKTHCGGTSLTTNAVTAAGNATLNFASVPLTVIPGMAVSDSTTPSAIPGGTIVRSKTATTVVMSANAAGTGVGSGDSIVFAALTDCGKAITIPNDTYLAGWNAAGNGYINALRIGTGNLVWLNDLLWADDTTSLAVGVGGTPPSVATGSDIFSATGITVGAQQGFITNAYYASGWKAWQTGYGALISQDSSGVVHFYTSSASASAGSALTLVQYLNAASTGAITLYNQPTTGTIAYAVCAASGANGTSGGAVILDTSATVCGLSAQRYKNLIPAMEIKPANALASLDLLRTETWRYKPQYQDHGERIHVSLIADDVERMNPNCVERDTEGKVTNYDDRCIEAYLVASIKELRRELAEIRRR